MPRSDLLQTFLDAAFVAFRARATDPRALASIARCRAALISPGAVPEETGGTRLAVCALLNAAADPANASDPDLHGLLCAFRRLEPRLTWVRRQGDMTAASAGIADGHANTLIMGPGGHERRSDVWLGASLLAPHMRYPDHAHPPEETYLVLSPGAFRQGDDPWFSPGQGGSFYNPPGIKHAMQSGDAPLFAFWLLWAGPSRTAP